MYSDCDIYVLDDCLSAVDGNVAKHIFQKGIIDILRKRKKTIIMATNQLEYLPQADSIAIIADGKIMEWDSYSNLLEREHFHSFLKEHYPDFQKKLISKETSLEDEFEQTTLNKGNDFLEFQPEQSKFEGEIGWNKYWEVISAGKSQYFILAVFLNMCRPLIRFFSFWWLISLWLPLSNSEITSSIPLSYCLTVFLASYLLQILLNLL
uniref:Uncharacterized protein n=1 Tax=Arcella intermedia TaxID=1963864 RepID=A0A6B2LH97_9EUKA